MIYELKDCRVTKNPVYVGHYNLGEGAVKVHFQKKPRWLHRTMMRILLGWTWENAK